MATDPLRRIALVVHPARPIETPLEVLRTWAAEHGLDVVQIRTVGSGDRHVADEAVPEPGDLIVTLGGDGTVLAALRAAAPVGVPVLGTACGSLGVLTEVTAPDLGDALQRIRAGDWLPRPLPALVVHPVGGADDWALNDFVAVRHGGGQLVARVSVDGELYVRIAGDGLIVATSLGSSGYSMAAGGPLLTSADTFVFTPLAAHGGNAPSLVLPAGAEVRVELQPGFAGFDVEIDGQSQAATHVDYTIELQPSKLTLVAFGNAPGRLTRLRQSRLVTDSARVLARDDRG